MGGNAVKPNAMGLFKRRVLVLFEIEVLAIKRRSVYEKISQLGDPVFRVLLLTFLFSSVLERAVQYGSIVLLCGSGLYVWIGYQSFVRCGEGLLKAKNKEMDFFGVGYLEIYIARFLRETMLFALIGLFLLALYLASHGPPPIAEGLKLIGALFLFTVFCFGWSLLAGLLSTHSEVIRKILDIASKVLFFASGIFYTAEDIPEEFHTYFLWNPIFCVTQILREGLFDQMSEMAGTVTSLICWIVASLFFGLLLLNQSVVLWRYDRTV